MERITLGRMYVSEPQDPSLWRPAVTLTGTVVSPFSAGRSPFLALLSQELQAKRAFHSIRRKQLPGDSPVLCLCCRSSGLALLLARWTPYSWGKEVRLGFSGPGDVFLGALGLCHIDSCGADCSPIILALSFLSLKFNLYFCSSALICLISTWRKDPACPSHVDCSFYSN